MNATVPYCVSKHFLGTNFNTNNIVHNCNYIITLKQQAFTILRFFLRNGVSQERKQVHYIRIVLKLVHSDSLEWRSSQ